jgi:hypothetical protein
MVVFRLLGWLLLLAGFVRLGLDLYAWRMSGSFQPKVLGELWYEVWPTGLQLFQPAVQRYLHPALWDDIVQPVLLWWAFAIFLGLGAALILVFQPRGGEPRRFRRR